MPDALYFRVSSDRQTTENQFKEVLEERNRLNSQPPDHGLEELQNCIIETPAPTPAFPLRTVFKANSSAIESLAERCIYVEQGRSAKAGGAQRKLYELMKRDAQLKRFDRLLIWKVSRLGRDMREVLTTVYELADLGITVVPVKSATGPITSAMGKLLWAVTAWFAEMENIERTEAINAGLKRARAEGKQLGRPKRVFDRGRVLELREEGYGIQTISKALGIPKTTVRRVLGLSLRPNNLDRPDNVGGPKSSTENTLDSASLEKT